MVARATIFSYQMRIIFHPSEIAAQAYENWGKHHQNQSEKKYTKHTKRFIYNFVIKANRNVFYFEKQRLHDKIFSGCEVETQKLFRHTQHFCSERNNSARFWGK